MQKSDAKFTNRLLSLDVFRGFTIVSMIVVNNPGSWDHVVAPFHHAAWHGCTFADLVFPFFLWIVGVTIVFSFANRAELGITRNQLLRSIILRTLLLFAIGLFLNGFPFGLISGYDFSWATIRIPGVLQRIAICYLVASIIVIYSSVIWQVIWLIALLVGYWISIKIASVPGFGAGVLEPAGNLAWYIDSNLLHGHTYAKAPVAGFDPEGVFSTLTAIATTLFGVLAGHFIRIKKSGTQKTIGMFIFGDCLMLIGLFMDKWMPINKNLWTVSYVAFTAGIAMVGFAGCYWLVDVKGNEKWFKPLQIYGLNVLTIFVLSGIIGRLTNFIKITGADGTVGSLKAYYYNLLFSSVDPMQASFLHALAFGLLMYLVAYLLYRTRIIIRV